MVQTANVETTANVEPVELLLLVDAHAAPIANVDQSVNAQPSLLPLSKKLVPQDSEGLLHTSSPKLTTMELRRSSSLTTEVNTSKLIVICLGKYLVLFFYPLDFTFVCPTEIIQFSDRAKEFRETNCEVVGCSIDSSFCHMEYTKKDRKKGGLGKMDIPLLADTSKKIAASYGCLCDDGDDDGLAYRATYIIDTAGILRHFSITDMPVGRSIDEVLRLVKAFQYTDQYGEVCPAQWNPGAPTMHADSDSKKTEEYWEKVHGKEQ